MRPIGSTIGEGTDCAGDGTVILALHCGDDLKNGVHIQTSDPRSDILGDIVGKVGAPSN